MARLLWDAALTGKARLPEDAEGQVKTLSLAPKDWVDLVKWLYTQIDGPPKAEVDVTSGGEPLKTQNDEQSNRAILTLADALREILPGANNKPEGAMDAPEQTAMAGTPEQGG